MVTNSTWRQQKTERGFSLVELLISATIITVVAGVVLARYSSFDSVILLKNLAYDVALSVREAQALSISVQGDNDNFESSYGVRFDDDSTEYILFRDDNEDGRYDDGEGVTTYTIGNTNRIGTIRVEVSSGTEEVNWLEVMFVRPEPDAVMRSWNNHDSDDIEQAEIEVISADGSNVRTVEILPTGQISVQ